HQLSAWQEEFDRIRFREAAWLAAARKLVADVTAADAASSMSDSSDDAESPPECEEETKLKNMDYLACCGIGSNNLTFRNIIKPYCDSTNPAVLAVAEAIKPGATLNEIFHELLDDIKSVRRDMEELIFQVYPTDTDETDNILLFVYIFDTNGDFPQ